MMNLKSSRSTKRSSRDSNGSINRSITVMVSIISTNQPVRRTGHAPSPADADSTSRKVFTKSGPTLSPDPLSTGTMAKTSLTVKKLKSKRVLPSSEKAPTDAVAIVQARVTRTSATYQAKHSLSCCRTQRLANGRNRNRTWPWIPANSPNHASSLADNLNTSVAHSLPARHTHAANK